LQTTAENQQTGGKIEIKRNSIARVELLIHFSQKSIGRIRCGRTHEVVVLKIRARVCVRLRIKG